MELTEEDASLLRSIDASHDATSKGCAVDPDSDSDSDILLEDFTKGEVANSFESPGIDVSDDESCAQGDIAVDRDESTENSSFWDIRAQTEKHFARGYRIPECTQVLVLNVYWALRRLSPSDQKQLSLSLGATGSSTLSYLVQACAALLGFSTARVQRIVEQVQHNEWQPCPPPQTSGREPTDRASPDDAGALHSLTRAALSLRASHGSAREFPRHVARLAVEGVEVGNKYHTSEHYGDIEFLAARVAQRVEAKEVAKPLGGLC